MWSVCGVVVRRLEATLHTLTVCVWRSNPSAVFSHKLFFFVSLCDSTAVMGSSWLWFRTSVWKLGNSSHRSFWAFCPRTGMGAFLTLVLSEVLNSANLAQIDVLAQENFWGFIFLFMFLSLDGGLNRSHWRWETCKHRFWCDLSLSVAKTSVNTVLLRNWV